MLFVYPVLIYNIRFRNNFVKHFQELSVLICSKNSISIKECYRNKHCREMPKVTATPIHCDVLRSYVNTTQTLLSYHYQQLPNEKTQTKIQLLSHPRVLSINSQCQRFVIVFSWGTKVTISLVIHSLWFSLQMFCLKIQTNPIFEPNHIALKFCI